jgi:hypothetical protein
MQVEDRWAPPSGTAQRRVPLLPSTYAGAPVPFVGRRWLACSSLDPESPRHRAAEQILPGANSGGGGRGCATCQAGKQRATPTRADSQCLVTVDTGCDPGTATGRRRRRRLVAALWQRPGPSDVLDLMSLPSHHVAPVDPAGREGPAARASPRRAQSLKESRRC